MQINANLKYIIGIYIALSVLLPSVGFATQEYQVVSVNDLQEANRILQQEIIPNMSVQAKQNDIVIAQKEVVNNTVRLNTIQYIGLDSFLEKDQETVIYFSGEALQPGTAVTILIPNSYIRTSTTANIDGVWSVEVPVDELDHGMYEAYVQTIYNGVRSDEEVVAQFEVTQEEALSNSTWIFLLSTGIAIVSLLFAITLQLRHNMQGFSTDPLV